MTRTPVVQALQHATGGRKTWQVRENWQWGIPPHRLAPACVASMPIGRRTRPATRPAAAATVSADPS